MILTRKQLLIGLGASIIVPKRSLAKTVPTGFNRTVSGGNIDPSAQAWANQVVANGGSVSAPRLALISTMIAGLKTDTVWDLLDRFWILAGENRVQALTDLKFLALATESAAMTFLASNGSNSAGYTATTGAYLQDTSYAFDASANWKQNSCSAMAYLNAGAANTSQGIGTSSGPSTDIQCYWSYSGSLYIRLSQGGAGGGYATAGPTGSNIGTRTGATINVTYYNGTNLGTDTTSSISPAGYTLRFVEEQSGTNRYAAVSLGGGLTGAQVTGNGRTTGLDGRLLTFLTAIGSN
jgi:hypothetical protein